MFPAVFIFAGLFCGSVISSCFLLNLKGKIVFQKLKIKTTSPQITFMDIIFDSNNLFFTLTVHHVSCVFIFKLELLFIKNVSRQQELVGVNVDKNVFCTWMLFYPVLRYCSRRRGLNHRAG